MRGIDSGVHFIEWRVEWWVFDIYSHVHHTGHANWGSHPIRSDPTHHHQPKSHRNTQHRTQGTVPQLEYNIYLSSHSLIPLQTMSELCKNNPLSDEELSKINSSALGLGKWMVLVLNSQLTSPTLYTHTWTVHYDTSSWNSIKGNELTRFTTQGKAHPVHQHNDQFISALTHTSKNTQN